jgi:hypothetical protein
LERRGVGNIVISSEPKPASRETSDPASSAGGARRNTVRTLLSRWRAAERRLRATPPGSPEWESAVADFDAARLAYQEAAESGSE